MGRRRAADRVIDGAVGRRRPGPAVPRRAAALLAALLVIAACGAPRPALRDRDCRPVRLRSQGTGAPVIGPEDLAVDAATGLLWISAHDRLRVESQARAGAPEIVAGGLHTAELESLAATGPGREGAGSTLELTRRGTGWGRPLRPHGFDLRHGTAGVEIAVVHRAYVRVEDGWRLRPRVERLELADDGLLRRRGPPVTSPGLCAPNDVLFLPSGDLLISDDHGTCEGPGRLAEDLLGLRRSGAHLRDGDGTRRVVTGIGHANGLARTPGPDGDILWVAATREDALLGYRLERLLRAERPLRTPDLRVPLGIGPDNLGADGDVLYVAGHPSLLRLALHRYGLPGGRSAPTRVLQVEPASGSPATILVADDGTALSAATVAVRWRDLLVVGAARGDALLVCRLAGTGARPKAPSPGM